MKKESVIDRFRRKYIEDESGCWLWTGLRNWRGYGQFSLGGHNVGAHRVAYELFCAPIPADREINHLCRVRACVNPRHLEAVPHRENLWRATIAIKASCARGHAYSEHGYIRRNQRNLTDGQTRVCRICKNAYEVIRRGKKRAAARGQAVAR